MAVLKTKKMMMGAALTVAFLLALGLAFAEEKAGKIAAKVDGRAIEMQEFEREVQNYMSRFKGGKGNLPDSFVQQIRTQAINSLINRELLLQESDKKGIKVSKDEVDKGINSIQGQFPSPEAFDEALKNMNLSRGDLERQYIQKTKIQTLLDKEVISKISVAEDEAKAYFDANPGEFEQKEQIRASHILIKVEKDADDKKRSEARKTLTDVKKKILAGEDFAELAKKYSQGPSGAKGGDLGYFAKGQMVKPFEDATFKLAKNEVSEIVETQFGYHLIKVVDHKAQKKGVYAESKNRIMSKLKTQRIQKQVGDYINKLRSGAKIENLIQ